MHSSKKYTVLVVDDSKIWMEKISLLLEDMECIESILLAENYEEAIPMLKVSPDFIFLDIKMPGKNGIELLRFIRANFSKPKICMVSDSVSMMPIGSWKSLGADGCLDKSNEFERIPEFIANNTRYE